MKKKDKNGIFWFSSGFDENGLFAEFNEKVIGWIGFNTDQKWFFTLKIPYFHTTYEIDSQCEAKRLLTKRWADFLKDYKLKSQKDEDKKPMKRLPKGFTKTTDDRGFQHLEFVDFSRRKCVIQMSSACYNDTMNSALWLKTEIREGDEEGAIHLTLDQVKGLQKIFQHWIDNAELFP